MLKPEEVKVEEGRLQTLIGEALAKVKEAASSNYWSYTREYQLGKLDIAKLTLQGILDDLQWLVPFIEKKR